MSSLINLFWKKKPTVPGSTKITEELLTSESHDTSGSKGDEITNSTLDSLSSERTSASSVFNMPEKQSSVIQNLYVMFEEHVVDNIGGINLLPEKKNFRPDVSPDDFQVYVDRLKGSYHLYVQEKELLTQESFDKEKTNATENLLLCYNTIPEKYFEPDFYLNLEIFEQEPHKLNEIQNTFEADLEKIKINLSSQISSKFGFILETINHLTFQERTIDKCIEAIKAIKDTNRQLKEKNTLQILEILKLKKKQLNLNKTKQILETVNVFKKIIPTLNQLVQKGNFESAISLLISSEQMFSQKLIHINCLKTYFAQLQDAKNLLQQSLTNEFETLTLQHILHPFSSENIQDADDLVVAQKVWKLIIAHIKIKEVSFSTFRPKLHEALKSFQTQFLTTFSGQSHEAKPELLLNYVRVYKQFFIRFSNIHNQCVSQVISYFKSILDAEDSQKTQTAALKIFSSTLQEFYSIYTLMVRGFNDKITQLLQMINLSALPKEQFSVISNIFEEIIAYFQESFDCQQKCHSICKSENEILNKTLLKITSSLLEQLSVSSLVNLRLFYEKQFFQADFNREKETLTQKMKNENWKPIEVPTESFDLLKYFHESPESYLSLKKKSIVINSKNFKLSGSYLALIQTISDISHFGSRFTSLREECVSKIFVLINLFISNIDNGILQGHSTSSALGGVITPEILAFAAATLSLLKHALTTIHPKILLTETSQANKTINTLISNLLAKISEMIRDLVLVEKCDDLKTISWDDTKTGFQVPTKHSLEILDKIKAVHKNISKFLPPEFSATVFAQIMDNLTDLYLPIFAKLEINNTLVAQRIKIELEQFLENLSYFDSDLHEFENKVQDIINHKCY